MERIEEEEKVPSGCLNIDIQDVKYGIPLQFYLPWFLAERAYWKKKIEEGGGIVVDLPTPFTIEICPDNQPVFLNHYFQDLIFSTRILSVCF